MAKTLVRHVMSSPVEVLQVGDSLDLARTLMVEKGSIRHLPVIDGDEQLVGLVTHRTIVGAWVSHGDPDHETLRDVARRIPVELLMEKDVLSTWPEAPAADVAGLMEKHRIGCLPVLDDGKVIGIVTESEFVRFARLYFERQDGT
ncbi:MAG TPA: CBS domain-containing protein [Polyangia bacterium]|jgi:CBS domain-containing membrane protein|nr:CBS domain-containing protein [Polyangia bacterium]